MKRFAMLALLSACVVTAACGDSTGPDSVNLTATWQGAVPLNTPGQAALLTMTLSHDTRTNALQGSGTLQGIPIVVTGAFAHPQVSLSITSQGYQPMNFSGTLVGEAEINGLLNGSGWANASVTIKRPS